jgi:hypothetical protein
MLKDENIPPDEVSVATISETVMVYYSHLKEATAVESCQLAFSGFKVREGRRLQASANGETGP